MTKSSTDTVQVARLFENFNLPDGPPEDADLAPPEPTFTVAEMSATRNEAWNEGYITASRSGARALGRESQQVFADLLARAEDMDDRLDAMAEHYADAIARWLVQVFVTAFPAMAADSMDGRIRRVAEQLRPVLRSQTRIGVRDATGCAVWCETMADVWRHVQTRQVEEPACGDIVISWPQGEARISNETTWQAILAAVMPLLGDDAAADAAADAGFQFIVRPLELIEHVG